MKIATLHVPFIRLILADFSSLQKSVENMALTFKLASNENTVNFNASTITSNLLKTENYGCFCRNLNSKNFTVSEKLSELTQGRPVNHVDEICRDLIQRVFFEN